MSFEVLPSQTILGFFSRRPRAIPGLGLGLGQLCRSTSLFVRPVPSLQGHNSPLGPSPRVSAAFVPSPLMSPDPAVPHRSPSPRARSRGRRVGSSAWASSAPRPSWPGWWLSGSQSRILPWRRGWKPEAPRPALVPARAGLWGGLWQLQVGFGLRAHSLGCSPGWVGVSTGGSVPFQELPGGGEAPSGSWL